jgi:hypothetical protein
VTAPGGPGPVTGRRSWPPGPVVVRAAVTLTWVFVVAAVAGAALPTWFAGVAVAASVLCFVLGCVAFVVGYLRAVERSRTTAIDLPGLFFLQHSAPAPVRRTLLGTLGVQIVVGLAAAAVRPFTPLAFCTLAPLLGLGLATLWSASHGQFPPRPQPST